MLTVFGIGGLQGGNIDKPHGFAAGTDYRGTGAGQVSVFGSEMVTFVNRQGHLFDKSGTDSASSLLMLVPYRTKKKAGILPLSGKALVPPPVNGHAVGIAKQSRIAQIRHLAMQVLNPGLGDT